ncbi:MAG: type II secretion system F family protein [Candidatus Aenigmatarchaeota archaeon]
MKLKKINVGRIRERLFYFTPIKYKQKLKKELVYAGVNEKIIERFIGFTFFFSVLLGVVIAFDLYMIGWGLSGIALGLGSGALALVIIQVLIILIADSRAAEVEKVLPDALQLMSANIRAGMTVDRAIWLAARPEFGIFEEEIRRVGAKTVGGKSIKMALLEIREKIKSDILDKAVRLLIEGIESGGELANLLEETANNIRVTQSVKKEIKASVTTYSIFIVFAAVLGAPMLYSLSLFFIEVMTTLWSPEILGGIELSSGGMGGGLLAKAGAPQITPDQLFWFAIASISTTTFFGALITGLIQTGTEKNGVKFIPLFMLGALAVFFLSHLMIQFFFGSFFQI